MASAFIPYGQYWSTPFARWQGNLCFFAPVDHHPWHIRSSPEVYRSSADVSMVDVDSVLGGAALAGLPFLIQNELPWLGVDRLHLYAATVPDGLRRTGIPIDSSTVERIEVSKALQDG